MHRSDRAVRIVGVGRPRRFPKRAFLRVDDTYHACTRDRWTAGCSDRFGCIGVWVLVNRLILVFWVVRLSGAVACGFLLQQGLQLRGILRESQADMLAGRRSHTSDDVADAMRQCSLATRLQHTSGGWLGPYCSVGFTASRGCLSAV